MSIKAFPLTIFGEQDITTKTRINNNIRSIVIKGIGADRDTSDYTVEIYVKDKPENHPKRVTLTGSASPSYNENLEGQSKYYFQPNNWDITFDFDENLELKVKVTHKDPKHTDPITLTFLY